MAATKTAVRNLRVGSVVTSGEKVLANQQGVRTRKGYRDVLLQDPITKKTRWSQWNASTQVWAS